MSCSDAGATYWAGDDGNPWGSVKYDSTTDPANQLFLSVDTGLARADVLGRAMVIYDAAGAPIACGIIEDGFLCTWMVPHACKRVWFSWLVLWTAGFTLFRKSELKTCIELLVSYEVWVASNIPGTQHV